MKTKIPVTWTIGFLKTLIKSFSQIGEMGITETPNGINVMACIYIYLM